MRKFRLSKEQSYLIRNIHLVFFAMGVFQLLTGSVLPLIRAEFDLPYRFGGWMNALFSVGSLTAGLTASLPVRKFGAKRTYLSFISFALIGLVLMTFTGKPSLLLVSMLMLGMTKGSGSYFGSQIASQISGGDAGLQNLVQAMFAGGACAAPLIVLLCGKSWRMAFGIALILMSVAVLHGLGVRIDNTAIISEEGSGSGGFGFMKTKLFWLCMLIMFSYMAIESSVIGWLVTYLEDAGGTSNSMAQIVSMLLWMMLLIGRFLVAAIAGNYRPWQLLSVMTGGIAISFTMLIFGKIPAILVVSALLLGLFMAGMYGTCVAGVGSLMQEYPLCMGMMIAMPGIGSIAAPAVVGVAADHVGMHRAMAGLYVLVVLLIIVTALYARYSKKEESQTGTR